MMAGALLLIDAGNSSVKAALYSRGQLGEVQVWAHADLASLGAFLDTQAVLPQQAWLVSVADAAVCEAIARQLQTRAVPLTRWHNPQLPAGFHNLYEAPTLGPDRLLAALGARQAFAAPVLVVASFGTATTVDLVAGPNFHGGLIAPGIGMMKTSLNQGTAHLPLTAGQFKTVPRTTHDAIYTGICAAQRGALEHMLQAAAAFGTPQLVVCGGAAALMRGVLPAHELLPHAVLRGLAVAAQASAKPHAP